MDSLQPPVIGFEAPPEVVAEGRGSLGRTPQGWLLLFAIFAVYVMIMVASAKLTNIGKQKDPYNVEETAVRMAMYQKGVFSSLNTTNPKMDVSSPKVDEGTITTLESKTTDLRATRLLVTARYESGDSLRKVDLNQLAKSDVPADQAFVAVYRLGSLSKGQADALAAKMPDSEFAYRLAKVHAHDKAGDSGPRKEFAPPWRGLVSDFMLFGALALAGLGVILWVVYFARRSEGKWAPLGHPAEPITKPEVDRFAFRAGLLMTTFVFLEFLIGGMMRHSSEAGTTFVLFAVMLLAVIGIHKLPALGLAIPLSRVGVSTKNLGKNILWGIGGYIAALPIIIICALIGSLLTKFFGQPTHPVNDIIAAGPNTYTVLALYFSASMVAPFWEEIMFRGTLMPALSGVFGRPLWGILSSSFLFAAIHPQGVPLWLALGSIGAMNGLLAYQTKSLVPCMVLHALNNALVLTLALVIS